MYHSICDEPEKGHPYFWINTSQKRFAEHMKFLHDNNYKVIDLSEAVRLISDSRGSPNLPTFHHSNIPQKKVVLTFDDGYADFYTHAFPVLQGYGFTATVFLPTDYIGNGRPGLCGKEHLTWDQVRDLAAAGVAFGSHTVSHPQLYHLQADRIEYELRESKEAIESHLNQTVISANPKPETYDGSLNQSADQPIDRSLAIPVRVDSFCYPYKFPEQDTRFVAALREALVWSGYHCCLSTRVGVDHEREELFALKRIPVNGGDELSLFKAKLKGAYDWVSKVQRLKKGLRSGSQKRQTSPRYL